MWIGAQAFGLLLHGLPVLLHKFCEDELQQLRTERHPAKDIPRRHHVDAGLDHLRKAHAAVLFEEPAEILALELRGALDQLGEMVGAVYTDDLLDRVFSRFCIGK